jgi:hypothetical protein
MGTTPAATDTTSLFDQHEGMTDGPIERVRVILTRLILQGLDSGTA